MKQKQTGTSNKRDVSQCILTQEGTGKGKSQNCRVRHALSLCFGFLMGFLLILAGGYSGSNCLIFSAPAQLTIPSLPDASLLRMEQDVQNGMTSGHMAIRMPNQVQLNVIPVMQLPELPQGCEITSLTALLQYYGFSVNKVSLCEEMLEYGLQYANPFVGYVGDPFDEHGGFGCYAPPIVQAANRYLSRQNTTLTAYDMSHTAFETLLEYVLAGTPVMVWTTQQTLDSDVAYTYEEIDWYRLSHCVVICGFDGEEILCADPLEGIVRYDRERMEQMYEMLYQQAVLIR